MGTSNNIHSVLRLRSVCLVTDSVKSNTLSKKMCLSSLGYEISYFTAEYYRLELLHILSKTIT